MNKIEIALDELAAIADEAANALPGTPRVVVHVVAVVLHGASEVAHVLDAADIERIRKERELGTAAGQGAYEASRNAGHT